MLPRMIRQSDRVRERELMLNNNKFVQKPDDPPDDEGVWRLQNPFTFAIVQFDPHTFTHKPLTK